MELTPYALYPYFWPLLRYAPTTYAQLRHLKIRGYLDEVMKCETSFSVHRLPILHAPALRNVNLFEWKSNWEIPRTWSKLTDLNISLLHPVAVSVLLQSCPDLVDFRCMIAEYQESINARYLTPTELPHHRLESLEVLLCDFTNLSLSLFFVPPTTRLRKLKMVAATRPPPQEGQMNELQRSLTRVITRSPANLVDLELCDCVFDERALVVILARLPRLTHLKIKGRSALLTFDVFKRLTPSCTSSSLAWGLEDD